jgi:hypothetical protein
MGEQAIRLIKPLEGKNTLIIQNDGTIIGSLMLQVST